jgi:hypothetical protein
MLGLEVRAGMMWFASWISIRSYERGSIRGTAMLGLIHPLTIARAEDLEERLVLEKRPIRTQTDF